MKILVLAGGNSSEREISLRSASSISKALGRLGHEVLEYDTVNGLEGVKDYSGKVSCVFPILHGAEGEDGAIQSVLEKYDFKYLGSDSKASHLCFNKAALKKEFQRLHILTPAWEVVDNSSIDRSPLLKKPFVLKPIGGGSSIDTFIVRTPAGVLPEYREGLKRNGPMLLEELIDGNEITVPILDETALPVIEIIPPAGKEFDYENKYNGESQELCPPKNVSPELQEQAQEIAEKLHTNLGLRHLSRTDIMISSDDRLYVLEINTIPGLTDQSLFPKSAQVNGLSMDKVVERFLSLVLS